MAARSQVRAWKSILDKYTVVEVGGVVRRLSQHAVFPQVRVGRIGDLCSPPPRRRVFAA